MATLFGAQLSLKLRYVLAAIFLSPFSLQCFAQETELPRIGPAPSFSLTTQDNRPLAWADLRGKPVVLTFIFTTCRSECPVLTAKLVDIQRRFSLEQKETPRFIAVSVEPTRDTPEVLKAYAYNFGADLEGMVVSHRFTGRNRRVGAALCGVCETAGGRIDRSYISNIAYRSGRYYPRAVSRHAV